MQKNKIREEAFKKILSHLKRKNPDFHISMDMGRVRKTKWGRTANCLVHYGAKHFGSLSGYAESKFLITSTRVKDIS